MKTWLYLFLAFNLLAGCRTTTQNSATLESTPQGFTLNNVVDIFGYELASDFLKDKLAVIGFMTVETRGRGQAEVKKLAKRFDQDKRLVVLAVGQLPEGVIQRRLAPVLAKREANASIAEAVAMGLDENEVRTRMRFILDTNDNIRNSFLRNPAHRDRDYIWLVLKNDAQVAVVDNVDAVLTTIKEL